MSGQGVLSMLLVAGGLVALVMALLRMWLGPTQADRVVALDVVFSVNVAFCGAAALLTGRALFLDVAIGLAATGFVATIAWARLIATAPGECE